ncbi:MAG: hypothetical protein ACLP1Q_02015 [Solirubrobacteraceae bacterium]
MSSRLRACGAVGTALACGLLGIAGQAPALADACPNAKYRSGASEHLPDCRAYEQVSPAEKNGLDAVTLQPLLPARSSACEPGEMCTIAYMNVGAAFAGAPGNEFDNAYLASRSASGWQTTPLSPPTPQAPANSRPHVSFAFSSDLSQTVLRVPLQQLTEGAPAGVYNLYLRGAGGGYSLLTTLAPPEPPAPGCARCFELEDLSEFAGGSSDFSHVIFEANDSLVAGAPGPGIENLYEAVGGHVYAVGVLPNGTFAPQGAQAGGGIEATDEHTGKLEHAISQDGSHVVFDAAAGTEEADSKQAGMTELYDRIDGAATIEISAPAAGAQPGDCETTERVCNAEPAQFWAASANGSVVFFTSKAALTKQSHVGPEPISGPEPRDNPGDDLYRYDVDSRTLTDLTPDVDSGKDEDPNGASVLGVVGASEDGSYVYFVAEGQLGEPGAGAKTGQPNLYVRHETPAGAGTVTFIATLAAPSQDEQEEIDEGEEGPGVDYRSDVADWTSRPTESQAYATPDGTHLAFMSVEPLTDYDNEQVGEEEGHGVFAHEVFEYSAETGQLVCASCDTNEARPLGSAFIGASLRERLSTPFHQPRVLSDDGSRLFFSSPDPLVPGLPGGSVKVFEYENGGVQLISGTEGGGSGTFLDASASGDDVFFATREQLAPGDDDELVDVYDARVDGGLPLAPALTPCRGAACQEPFTPPPTFTAPISASFSGAGNLAPPPPAKPTRAQLLARALAKCRKLHGRKRRAACTTAARRRYAPKAKGTRRARAATRHRSRT